MVLLGLSAPDGQDRVVCLRLCGCLGVQLEPEYKKTECSLFKNQPPPSLALCIPGDSNPFTLLVFFRLGSFPLSPAPRSSGCHLHPLKYAGVLCLCWFVIHRLLPSERPVYRAVQRHPEHLCGQIHCRILCRTNPGEYLSLRHSLSSQLSESEPSVLEAGEMI